MQAPTDKPSDPNFGSGPTAKHPGFRLEELASTPFGRSHRSGLCKDRINKAMEMSRRLLRLPEDYLIAIVPGSDTGAFEMAMWNLLGERPVDVCAWDTFGKGWLVDAKQHLKLEVNALEAKFGEIPDLSKTNPDHDIVFTWNGTTSGVMVPNADWISDTRRGLTLCDATSAIFAMDLPWHKLDVITYSWQKVLGGEAAHGVLILSPRAVARIDSYSPPWPVPKLFRLKNGGKLNKAIFEGEVINTVSMLCIEDLVAALVWAESLGGGDALVTSSKANLAILEDFVREREWIQFLAADPSIRSHTSVCFTLSLTPPQIASFISILAKNNVAFDIAAYRDAPPGIRIWAGPNVEAENLKKLLPWLDFAYESVKGQ